ncbi:hypothetical protein ACGFIP_27795 [Micromonospora zamorensis]|uniref:hypothetical protein n=1 Tax=Micromonospora zamorensis TaxID=709883 RepID=UPI0033C14BC4
MTPTALRALVPITVLAGLAACTTTSPAPLASGNTTTPTPSVAPASSSASPTGSVSPTGSASPATPTSRAACPVSAATLHRASGLGDTHRIDPDHINCARRWATAGVIAVDPSMQGDGVLVFEYTGGGWKKLGEGSALECSPFGIPNELGDQLGCRDQ